MSAPASPSGGSGAEPGNLRADMGVGLWDLGVMHSFRIECKSLSSENTVHSHRNEKSGKQMLGVHGPLFKKLRYDMMISPLSCCSINLCGKINDALGREADSER